MLIPLPLSSSSVSSLAGREYMSESEFIGWITNTASSHASTSFVQSLASSLKSKRSNSQPHTSYPAPASGSPSATSPSYSGSASRAHDPELEQDLRAAFAAFDQDSNGYLSKSELRDALRVLQEQELTDEELDRLMRQADRDGDGLIGIEDFLSSILPSKPS